MLPAPACHSGRNAAGILKCRLPQLSGRSRCPVRGGNGPGRGDDSVAAGCGSSRMRAARVSRRVTRCAARAARRHGAARLVRGAGAACRFRTIASNQTALTWGVLTGEQRWLAHVPDDHEQPGSVAGKCVGPAVGSGRLRSCQLLVEGGGAPVYRAGHRRVRRTATTARCGMRSSYSGSGAIPRRAWSLWWPATVPRSLTGRLT